MELTAIENKEDQQHKAQPRTYIKGKRYVCYSLSRRDKGYTWFEIATFGLKEDDEPCFSAMCFFPGMAELDLIVNPEHIPDELWKTISVNELSEKQALLYTFKDSPEVVHAGNFHQRMSFPRFQGYGGPYISGMPIVQIDKIILLDTLIKWHKDPKLFIEVV